MKINKKEDMGKPEGNKEKKRSMHGIIERKGLKKLGHR